MADMVTERVGWGPDEGVQAISVGATTTFTFTNRRRYFKPENLVIQGSATSGLMITDIKIGTKSMLGSAQPVPAAMFVETSTVGHLSWPELGINETVKVSVRNNLSTAGTSVTSILTSLIGQASKE